MPSYRINKDAACHAPFSVFQPVPRLMPEHTPRHADAFLRFTPPIKTLTPAYAFADACNTVTESASRHVTTDTMISSVRQQGHQALPAFLQGPLFPPTNTYHIGRRRVVYLQDNNFLSFQSRVDRQMTSSQQCCIYFRQSLHLSWDITSESIVTSLQYGHFH